VRTREAILAVALALPLALGAAGCSGDDDGDAKPNPTDPVSEISLECEKYDNAAKAITAAQSALYSAPGSEGAIDRLSGELAALEEDAPSEIKAALTRLETGFRKAGQYLANPTPANSTSLVELAPQLSTDGQKVTAYIASECD
jgi:hypothetical protein